MPTKQELLEQKTKAELLEVARDVDEPKVKRSMRKPDIVDVLADSRKLKKADLQ